MLWLLFATYMWYADVDDDDEEKDVGTLKSTITTIKGVSYVYDISDVK